MPINTGKDQYGYFVRYGHQHKYYYNPNNKRSFLMAYNKALRQMHAIKYSNDR